MSNDSSAGSMARARWRRIWEHGCVVVSGAALLIPAIGLLVFGPGVQLRFVGFLFVGIAALGARSSLTTWLDTRHSRPALGQWILTGVLAGAIAAFIGSIAVVSNSPIEVLPFTTAGIVALMALSLVRLSARSKQQHTGTTLVITTVLNIIVAAAGGHEIALTLVQLVGTELTSLSSILIISTAVVCGAGIGGWNYAV